MRLPSRAAALTAVPLVVLLGFASASCTHSDDTHVAASGGTARAQTAAASDPSPYPSIQPDAADGHVHEYY
jgi:hypothetical protein